MSRVSYKMYTLDNGILLRGSHEFIRAGSIVNVQLHSGRVVKSNVVLIQQTVAGIKIRALSNSLLLNKIDPEQIVEVLEY